MSTLARKNEQEQKLHSSLPRGRTRPRQACDLKSSSVACSAVESRWITWGARGTASDGGQPSGKFSRQGLVPAPVTGLTMFFPGSRGASRSLMRAHGIGHSSCCRAPWSALRPHTDVARKRWVFASLNPPYALGAEASRPHPPPPPWQITLSRACWPPSTACSARSRAAGNSAGSSTRSP